MKKTATFLMLTCLSLISKAQNLQSVTIIPANPTAADTVKAVAELMFTSGGCDLQSSNVSVNGSQVDVEVKHCTGMLTFICYATDTVTLGVLPTGTYWLNFSALTGSWDLNGNCTNFVAGGQQTVNFQVSGSTAISAPNLSNIALRYDQDRRALTVNGNAKGCRLQLIDLTGRTLYNGPITGGTVPLNSPLSSGIFIYSLRNTIGESRSGRILVR